MQSNSLSLCISTHAITVFFMFMCTDNYNWAAAELRNVQQIGVVHLFALIIFQPATANGSTNKNNNSSCTHSQRHTHTHTTTSAEQESERVHNKKTITNQHRKIQQKKRSERRERERKLPTQVKIWGVNGNFEFCTHPVLMHCLFTHNYCTRTAPMRLLKRYKI